MSGRIFSASMRPLRKPASTSVALQNRCQLNASHSIRNITSSSNLRNQRKSTPQDPELPSFSFKDLGASPTVKAVVYTGIGILAIAETIFYYNWIHHYFYPDSSEKATHWIKRIYDRVRPSADGAIVAGSEAGKHTDTPIDGLRESER